MQNLKTCVFHILYKNILKEITHKIDQSLTGSGFMCSSLYFFFSLDFLSKASFTFITRNKMQLTVFKSLNVYRSLCAVVGV